MAEAHAGLTDRFAAAWQAVGGSAHVVHGLAAARQRVLAILAERGIDRAVTWAEAELGLPGLAAALTAAGVQVDAAPAAGCASAAERAALRQAAAVAGAGITGVQAAVAATGTLMLIAGPGRPRSTSLLPPLHVALVPAASLVPGLPDLHRLLRDLARSGLPSAVNLVTGPSRTADVEGVLTMGVHGPGETHAVLVL